MMAASINQNGRSLHDCWVAAGAGVELPKIKPVTHTREPSKAEVAKAEKTLEAFSPIASLSE